MIVVQRIGGARKGNWQMTFGKLLFAFVIVHKILLTILKMFLDTYADTDNMGTGCASLCHASPNANISIF